MGIAPLGEGGGGYKPLPGWFGAPIFRRNVQVQTGICMILPENRCHRVHVWVREGGWIQWLFGQCPNEQRFLWWGFPYKPLKKWWQNPPKSHLRKQNRTTKRDFWAFYVLHFGTLFLNSTDTLSYFFVGMNEFPALSWKFPYLVVVKSLYASDFMLWAWGRWIVKWRLEGDEMETMRGTDRSIGNPPEHQASDFLKNSIWTLIQYTMSIKWNEAKK